MLDNIPDELKSYNQWVVWKFEGGSETSKPTKIPYSPKTGYTVSIKNYADFSSFEEAKHALNSGIYNGLGFVLTENDPYAFIDLDDTNGNQEEFEKQNLIFNEFNSYAELSPSGKGLHIIIKGSIPTGRRRSKIELYSSGRYMTMTGNVYRNTGINDYNNLLNTLYERFSAGEKVHTVYDGRENARYSNEQVLEYAKNAANGDKFCELYYAGNWQKYYESQSEADFALVDMIAFYSENREQVQELFLCSELGQREKSRAQYRIDRMLNRCFDRMLPPVDIDGLRNQIDEMLAKKVVENKPENSLYQLPVNEDVFTPPPGLVGDIARFIYDKAPHAVPEIALAGAIGLMSGICGRCYNISGAGLNQYMMILASSGIGKESISSGITTLISAVGSKFPDAWKFIGPAEISSKPAIINHMSNNYQSFVSILNEIGLTIQQMSSPKAPTNLTGLKKVLLDLYGKSGKHNILSPTIYSDSAKNSKTIEAPALTILGDSTISAYYKGLSKELLSDGLLPRFIVFECESKKPYFNENAKHVKPTQQLIDKVSNLCHMASLANSKNEVVDIKYDDDCYNLQRDFNNYTVDIYNRDDDEISKILWSRAYMKVAKLAGIVAAGVNPFNPVITCDIWNWAIKIVLHDIHNVIEHFKNGEYGDTDSTSFEAEQIEEIKRAIEFYLSGDLEKIKGYINPTQYQLVDKRIIPLTFLSRYCRRRAPFRKDKRKSESFAVKCAIGVLIDDGTLSEIPRNQLKDMLNIENESKCYIIKY